MELIDFGGFYITQVQEKWNFVKTIFTTRFDHWRYEEEVRVFCDLNEKDPVSGHFFVDYSADLQLKEIILAQISTVMRLGYGNAQLTVKA